MLHCGSSACFAEVAELLQQFEHRNLHTLAA
jgi:hypothetical protein